MSFREAFTKSKEQLLDYDDNASLFFGGTVLLCVLLPFSIYYFSRLFSSLTGAHALPKSSKAGSFLHYCKCALCENVYEIKRKDCRNRFKSPIFLIQTIFLIILTLILLRVILALSSVSEIQAFNPFNILGISDGITNEKQIKKAYRTLSLKLHPDKNPNDPSSAAKFIMVAKAYQALTDEVSVWGGSIK